MVRVAPFVIEPRFFLGKERFFVVVLLVEIGCRYFEVAEMLSMVDASARRKRTVNFPAMYLVVLCGS